MSDGDLFDFGTPSAPSPTVARRPSAVPGGLSLAAPPSASRRKPSISAPLTFASTASADDVSDPFGADPFGSDPFATSPTKQGAGFDAFPSDSANSAFDAVADDPFATATPTAFESSGTNATDPFSTDSMSAAFPVGDDPFAVADAPMAGASESLPVAADSAPQAAVAATDASADAFETSTNIAVSSDEAAPRAAIAVNSFSDSVDSQDSKQPASVSDAAIPEPPSTPNSASQSEAIKQQIKERIREQLKEQQRRNAVADATPEAVAVAAVDTAAEPTAAAAAASSEAAISTAASTATNEVAAASPAPQSALPHVLVAEDVQQLEPKSIANEPLTSNVAVVDTVAADAAVAQAAALAASLQLQVTAAEAAAAVANAAAAAATATAAAATATSAQLQIELATAKDELGELKARAENEHIRLAQANVQKQFLQSQIDKLQTQETLHQSNLEHLQQTLVTALRVHSEAGQEWAQRLAESQAALDRQTTELGDMSRDIATLRESVENDAAEREQLQLEVARERAGGDQARAEAAALKAALATAQHEHDAALASARAAFQESADTASAALAACEQQLQAAQQQQNEAERREREAGKRLDDEAATALALTEEMHALRQQVEEQSKEMAMLREKVASQSAGGTGAAGAASEGGDSSAEAIQQLQSQHHEAIAAFKSQAQTQAAEQGKQHQQRIAALSQQHEQEKQAELGQLRAQFQQQTERQKAMFVQLQQQLKDAQAGSARVTELESKRRALADEFERVRAQLEEKERLVVQVRDDAAKEAKRVKKELSKAEASKALAAELTATVERMQKEAEERKAKEVADARKKKSLMAYLVCPEDPPTTGHSISVETTLGGEFRTQWFRSMQGNNFAPIKGATLPAYHVCVDDVGSVLRAECVSVDSGDRIACDTQGAVTCSAELLAAVEQSAKKGEVQFKVAVFPAPPKATADKFVLLNTEKIKIREADKTKIKEEFSEHTRVLLHATHHDVMTVFVTDKLFFTYSAASPFERDLVAAMIRLYAFPKMNPDKDIQTKFVLRAFNEARVTAMQNPIEAALEQRMDHDDEQQQQAKQQKSPHAADGHHNEATPASSSSSSSSGADAGSAHEHAGSSTPPPSKGGSGADEVQYDEDGYIIRADQAMAAAAATAPARKARAESSVMTAAPLPAPSSNGGSAADADGFSSSPQSAGADNETDPSAAAIADDAPLAPAMVVRIRAASEVAGPTGNDLRRNSLMRPPASSVGVKSANRRSTLLPPASQGAAATAGSLPVSAGLDRPTTSYAMPATFSAASAMGLPSVREDSDAPLPLPAPAPALAPVTAAKFQPEAALAARAPSPLPVTSETAVAAPVPTPKPAPPAVAPTTAATVAAASSLGSAGSTSTSTAPVAPAADADAGKTAVQLIFQEVVNVKQEGGKTTDLLTTGELLVQLSAALPDTDLLFRFRLPGVAAATTEWQLNAKCIRDSPNTPGQLVVKVPRGVTQLALARYKVDPRTTAGKPPLFVLPQWAHAAGGQSKLSVRYKVDHRYVLPQTDVSFLAQIEPEGAVVSCGAHEPANSMRYAADRQKCLWKLPLTLADGAVSVIVATSSAGKEAVKSGPVAVNFMQDASPRLMSGLEVDANSDAAQNAASNCVIQRVVKRLKIGAFSAQ